mgnify:CR=1 FL=1
MYDGSQVFVGCTLILIAHVRWIVLLVGVILNLNAFRRESYRNPDGWGMESNQPI